MKWLIILLLAGCAAQKPVQVEIPVHVPCVEALPERPVNSFGQGEYPGDKAAAQRALTDSLAWERYSVLLEVELAGCVRK
jgi:hypothetical protein